VTLAGGRRSCVNPPVFLRLSGVLSRGGFGLAGMPPADLPHPHQPLTPQPAQRVTEADYTRPLDATHQQLCGPLVVVSENVPRNIFRVLCPAALCGRGSAVQHETLVHELACSVSAT